MTDRQDPDPSLSAEEREQLAVVADRLRCERPVPSPDFRSCLRRQLLDSRRAATVSTSSFRLRVASYVAAGSVCLLVAAAGLVGAGPFAA